MSPNKPAKRGWVLFGYLTLAGGLFASVAVSQENNTDQNEQNEVQIAQTQRAVEAACLSLIDGRQLLVDKITDDRQFIIDSFQQPGAVALTYIDKLTKQIERYSKDPSCKKELGL